MINRTIFTVMMTVLIYSTAYAAGIEYQIGVDGVACPFCVYGIEKQLNRIQGVESIATDIKSGSVTVTMHDGTTLKQSDAARAVDKAGFTLRSFNRKETSE